MKRFTFVLMALVAIAWLAGCGNENPTAPIESASTQELTQARSDTSVFPPPSTGPYIPYESEGASKALGQIPPSIDDGIVHVMRDTTITWGDLKRIYHPSDGGDKPNDKK